MCGRFTQRLSADAWSRHLGRSVNAAPVSYNVSPTQQVLCFDGEAVETKTWSFLPRWAKGRDLKPVINARIETAAEKPFFRQAMRRGRIAMLADGFYEWKKTPDGQVPHLISLADGEPFAFAALDDGAGTAICTCEPNRFVAEIHNRMPVILRLEEIDRWLANADWSPLADDELTAVAVSQAVNSPANNRPEVAQPVDADG